MSKKKSRTARTRNEAASTPVPAASSSPAQGGWTALVKIADPASVALLFAWLLSVTWMRWSEPLVDFPRSLYAAWRVSTGALPYVDVQSWYGPLPHLVEGAAFKIFGAGMDTMVWLNIAVTIGALLLLRGILGLLGNRLLVWLGSVVFLLAFAFAHTIVVGNYNFITPYASQATYGLAGLLLTIWALLQHIRKNQPLWLGLAGAGVGVTFVNKPEPLLAAAGAAALYLAVNAFRQLHASPPEGGRNAALRGLGRGAGWMAAGFISVWLAVFIVLALMGGPSYAFSATNWVANTVFSESYRHAGESSAFIVASFGFDTPGKNFLTHLLYGGLFVLAAAAILLAGRMWSRARSGSAMRWGAVGLAGGTVVAVVSTVNWQKSGMGLVFPTVLAAIYFIGCALRAARRGDAAFSRLLGLAVFGVAAALMLARMPLNGRLYHYGFFMMPLAVEFLLLLLMVELPRQTARDGTPSCVGPAAFTALTLCAVISLWRISANIYSMKTLAVGEGRDRFYTLPPSAKVLSGYLLKSMIEEVRTHEPGARSLLAVPESAAVNYHLRLPNPILAVDFQPIALAFIGKERILHDLSAHPPDAVVLYSRNLDEYGVDYFGETADSGAAILQWIQQNYHSDFTLVMPDGKSLYNSTGNVFDIYRRNDSTPAAAP